MVVTIDIKEDLRYQQGKLDTAKRMLQAGIDILQVQHFTEIEISQLKSLAKELQNLQ